MTHKRRQFPLLRCLFFLLSAWVTTNSQDLIQQARQLTYDGLRAGEGYFSANGKQLVFQSERDEKNPFYQIYRLDLTTGETTRVSTGIGKTTCAFFNPVNNDILFASTHLDPQAKSKQVSEFDFRASGKQRRYSWDYDADMDVFSVSSTRNNGEASFRRLTRSPGYDAEAAYSPDGTKIVFCSLRHAYTEKLTESEQKQLDLNPSFFGEIYLMNADGSNQTRLTYVDGYDGGPFFSPDGQRIVWRRFNEKGDRSDVYTMKLDGSDVQQVTYFESMSWAPYYHPSGDYIIFASNKFGFDNFELFIVDASGMTEPIRVTDLDGFDGLPVFAPSGNQLCWTSNRTNSGKSQLFLGNWDHQAALAALAVAPTRKRDPGTLLPAISSSPENSAMAAGATPAIQASDLVKHVTYLASDELEGRMTASSGAKAAADYIISQLEMSGLKPLNKDSSFRQQFEFTKGAKILESENKFAILSSGQSHANEATSNTDDVYKVETDFLPMAFSANGRVEGEIVFGGYGLALPNSQGGLVDPYAGADVTDKIVMILRYTPEDIQPKRKAELNRYAGLYYKAKIAQQRGAKAVLFVTGPNSPNAGSLFGLNLDSSQGPIVAASITGNLADQLLASSGKTLKTLQTALDTENPHAENGFTLKDVQASISVSLERVQQQGYNIVGMIPSSGSDEYILLGAHYDHLGKGVDGSRRTEDDTDVIHNGADDNASGVALLIELAAYLNQQHKEQAIKLERNLLFGFWSGEELGLLGSSRFADQTPVPIDHIKAYLNFDMVGRLRENKLILQGVGSAKEWTRLIERRNVVTGFDLKLQEDPYLPTDATSFYAKGIPILSFFTGSHDDYHRPSDDPDTLNYQGLEKITRFASLITRDLSSAHETPSYLQVEKQASSRRAGLRVYLGTIPDYAAEVKGLRLSGVRPNGPADKAGLQSQDIVIEFAGIEVTNIEDYMVAFNAVKIDQPTTIVVLRQGKRQVLTITPEGRR